MLYIEGPPGVGYSVNNDKDYVWSDKNTAIDFMSGLNAFRERFQGVDNIDFANPLWLSGESYAGMYVPFFTK
jgi:cathepsin A (carboxypeptidase C)